MVYIYDICPGPDNSLLFMNKDGNILQYVLNKSEFDLELLRSLETKVEDTWEICYDKKCEFLMSVHVENMVHAIKLHDGSTAWHFSGKVNGHSVEPMAVCSDNAGRTFVGNRSHGCLWVLDIQTGNEICKEEWGLVGELYWSDTPPQLKVMYGNPYPSGIDFCSMPEIRR